VERVPGFPHAPIGWLPEEAEHIARGQGIRLGPDHFEMLNALQQYFARKQRSEVNIRELHDALDERFHSRGGIRYLYHLFPGGPVAQGCALAGLPVPAGALNRSFGSVQ
jgi:tRNA 2-thiouridine synthesizing protein E